MQQAEAAPREELRPPIASASFKNPYIANQNAKRRRLLMARYDPLRDWDELHQGKCNDCNSSAILPHQCSRTRHCNSWRRSMNIFALAVVSTAPLQGMLF